ncbi:winged helix-turn-helix transcriptional regulator [Haloarcula nitratireducens]|uniref:Winged helix-turn-helix transcriptional regulator n=1 Tax=Haloarcula nitratireducens TaxID=2487749 RepID=A0AAW4PDE8_9EURY|nr:winged helix-turn-helix transcriptional regulator [Halomicroarcula nitratireducens]MBX0295762.1 winged helix-turn-helix transcriptional regulator [Halomicroarcula nitratireducens]
MSPSTPSDDRVAQAVTLISKKWHPVIIQSLLDDGPLRFNELQERLDGISGKVLTDSLADLQENDLIERHVVSESPKRVEYDLTRAGRELQAVMETLADWGKRNLGESTRPTVLVVDDDPRLARMHAGWLAEEYDVETAFNGKDAITALSDEIDVVLLDRRMPGLSGDDLLEKIREANLDAGVVLLTAVEPDVDVADMEFDAYLLKPGEQSEVREVVAEVLERTTADDDITEHYSLLARRALLDARLTAAEREASDEYQRLLERLDAVEAALDDESSEAEETTAITERLNL